MDFEIYTEVRPFYEKLTTEISKANKKISMMYLTFDHGHWSKKILDILKEKIRQGVSVRIMIDSYGLALDNFLNLGKNLQFMNKLSKAGIDLTLFKGSSRSILNYDHMHCKMCAIDENTVLMGGSNIGDYYINWQDTNICIKGNLKEVFHKSYDYIRDINQKKSNDYYYSGIKIKDIELLFTIPNRHYDIYNRKLKLINESKKELYIWTWYFLPDKEMYKTLIAKAKEGVNVNIILSKNTRFSPINLFNRTLIKKLKKHGIKVHQYSQRFTHSKVYWNEKNNVLLGSSNFNRWEFNHNFESCLYFNNRKLVSELKKKFYELIRKD